MDLVRRRPRRLRDPLLSVAVYLREIRVKLRRLVVRQLTVRLSFPLNSHDPARA